MMKQGDLVKGMPGSPYGITGEHMKLGRVESVDGEQICIVVLEHEDASKRGLGPYPVETKWFELVGHVKPFEREEAMNKLAENRSALLFYDLRSADLSDADLSDADLSGADLSGADLDYSVWPLWCGGIHVRTDKRIMCQLAYHFCAQDCDDLEYIAARNAILTFANQFHRAGECGILEEIK